MKIKYILSFVCLFAFFASCSDDTDPVLPNYPASVLNHPENGTLYVLEKVNEDKDVLTVSWTASIQEGLAVGAQSYYLQVDVAGRNFESAVMLTEVAADSKQTAASTYSATITVKDLNAKLVQNLMMIPDSLQKIEFRVITHIGSSITVINSSASNVFSAQVIPYSLVPESVFFVGNMFGDYNSWNNASHQFIFFRSNPEAVNTYTGKFVAGGEFKLFEASNLGSWDVAYGGASNSLSTGGGNIGGFETTGYYTVTADIENLTYSIKAYDASKAASYTAISLTGLGSDIALTQASYDPHIWFIDNATLTAGKANFKAASKTWGGTTFPFGGDSESPISVDAGKYFVSFNDLTGEYVFYALKK